MITSHSLKKRTKMSKLTDFLLNEYVPHHGLVWNPATMTIRAEYPQSAQFEIEDKKPRIVQPVGMGVAIFRQGNNSAEVIDLEDFMKTVHQSSGVVPSCCDFVLAPVIGSDYIVLNELTHSKSEVILPFVQPQTGEKQEGKLEKARKQLKTTIERLYEVSDFCDQFAEKTALFSCRLSDKKSNGIMAKSARSFSKPIYKLQRMKLQEKLPHGFVLKMRVYDAFYPLV